MRKRRPGGQTHVVLEPVALLRRLAWMIPPAEKNEIRFYGVLAARAAWRSEIVPGPAAAKTADGEREHRAALDADVGFRTRRASSIPWAELLRRVHGVDALECERCQGRMRVVEVVLDPAKAQKILGQLGLPADPPLFAPPRRPP